jgi:hypothetical protein
MDHKFLDRLTASTLLLVRPYIFCDGGKNAVDEPSRFLRGKSLSQFDSFVYDNRAGNTPTVNEFESCDAQNNEVDDWHSSKRPTDEVLFYETVE